MRRAVLSGLPVVKVGRGSPDGFTRRTPDRFEQIGRRRLAVRTRDTETAHRTRGMTVEAGCDRTEDVPDVADLGFGDAELEWPLHKERDCSGGDCIGRMLVAVGRRAAHTGEAAPRGDPPAVEIKRCDFDPAVSPKREHLDIAFDYFQLALKKDPDHALAHAGVAYVWLSRGDRGMVPSPEAMARARASAMRALELDDGLAEVHELLARTAPDPVTRSAAELIWLQVEEKRWLA